jgi:conjugative transposon TraM protein
MQQQHSVKFLQRRKFLFVAPLLVIPFITMLFGALGGGKEAGTATAITEPQGLNLQLPDASFKKDNPTDKLGYYEKAAADSAKLRDLAKKDPYISKGKLLPDSIQDSGGAENPGINPYAQQPGVKYEDANEAKVYQKLHELNNILHDTRGNNQQLNRSDFPDGEDNGEHGQLAELDKMMQRLNTAGSAGNDSSMQQINNVLEKVLDVQYPQRMREKLQKQSALHTGQVFAVTTPDFTSTISLLDTGGGTDKNSTAFFSAREEAEDSSLQRGIEAVVHETQTLVNGAIVKMRLMDDIFINGQLVSRGNFIFGTATLNNERLEIAISSVRNGNSLLPVKLDVYDMDGIRGIYIPGAITRDVAKQSSDNALQSIALSSLDPSIGTQAASAGIETAKNLLTKRIKIVRVLIKAGYKILLKDNNQP